MYSQVLCLTEHHLKEFEINNTSINGYNLGAYYCRKTWKFGGVGIYVHEALSCAPVDLIEYCNEQDLEVCDLKFRLLNNNFVFCVYTGHQQGTLELLYIYLNPYLINYTQIP